jgi:hypothetical protein
MHMHMGGGSHLPVLMKLMSITEGPVLELGTGLFSTPYLHWSCFPNKRKLISYENKLKYFELNKQYECDYHKVNFVEEWDKVDLNEHWSIVLVDHNPGPRRREEVKRLANLADYIVVHDTQGRANWYYHYSEVYPLFKYRYDFTKVFPLTTVLSNLKDLLCLSKKD